MSKMWLIRVAAQYLKKWKKRVREKKKRAHELGQLPTSLAPLTDQYRKGNTYLHLKLNVAKSYKQEVSPNYTHNIMEA